MSHRGPWIPAYAGIHRDNFQPPPLDGMILNTTTTTLDIIGIAMEVTLLSVITCPSCGGYCGRADANGCLHVFLRMHALQKTVAPEQRRLLRVLLVRKRQMSPDPAGKRLLRLACNKLMHESPHANKHS